MLIPSFFYIVDEQAEQNTLDLVIYSKNLRFLTYQLKDFYLRKYCTTFVVSFFFSVVKLKFLIIFDILRIWINLEKIPGGVCVNEPWRKSQVPGELWRQYLLSVLTHPWAALQDYRLCLVDVLKL